MTAAPTKRTTLPTLQTAITKTRAQHAASPPLHCPWQEGRPACSTASQRQTDAGASLCSMRRFTACTLPSAINDFQIEPGVRRPNATARHAKQHGTACKTARRGTTGHAHQTLPLTHAMWHRSTKCSHKLSAPWGNGKWPPALDIHQARLWHRGHGGGW